MTEETVSPYYQPTLRVRLMATGGILAVFGVVLCFFFLTMPSDVFYQFLGFLGLYLMPGFGKESIVPLAMAFGISWWQITLGIVVGDMALAIIIAYNFDLLLRLPLLGRVLRYFTTKTNEVLQKYLWIKGLSLVGLFLFMYIPFMGSSAINTTIVGRLLSVPPKTLLTIVFVGSILATLTMAVGMQAILELWAANPVYAVVAVLAVVIVAVVCWKLWQKYTEKRFGKGQ
ncbi:MAG TPA: small multi-drug export protein [Methanocorpusculum sp.]|nr:small multi-drug export protein [Candidatus Methanocorpusculum faecipullorum]HJK07217.1 small multi-drug export protein [Methanocorpusculum sp.]HJK65813.1 small multi-drug export protein [Methanocorpusculum sp.]HJK70815.1 small multi-drug export protein [Methanocorpusculum sp.]HJK72851.1 small multi-drug export protein [Methanocorpusculum sp.]